MTLTKASARALRHPCKVCGKAGDQLYWAKDDTRPGRGFVLIDNTPDTFGKDKVGQVVPESSRHVCSGTPDAPKGDADVLTDETPDVTPDNAPEVTPDQSNTIDQALKAVEVMRGLFGAQPIDKAEVERIAREVVAGVVYPTKTVVVKDAERIEVEGATHKRLASVVRTMSRGGHVMMVGPAGSGKSTIARQAAQALGLRYFGLSCYPQMPPSALVGYKDANGNFHSTAFIDAYTNGGVFNLDEVDNSHSSTLNVLNEALANGHMLINNEMVKRHPEFRLVAAANTYGRGATRQYVGRQAMDAATLDRFVVKTIDYDEALEAAACHATGASGATVDKVLAYIRKLRKSADANGIQVVLSPRASMFMCAELHAGADWDEAVDECVRKGLDDSTWRKISA